MSTWPPWSPLGTIVEVDVVVGATDIGCIVTGDGGSSCMRGVGKMDGEGAPADGDAEVAPLCGVAGVSCEMAGIGGDVDVTVTGI